MGLFGSTLEIKDAFSRTLNNFIGQTSTANSNVNNLTGSINHLNSATTGLSNNTSKSLGNINNSFTSANNNIKNSSNSLFRDLNNNVNSFSSSMLGTIAKVTAGWLSLKGAIKGVSESLKAGMEYQNASTFLQATYGEAEGKEKFKFATDFANKTPFEEGEISNGLARAKALGMKDDIKSLNMYADIGSMAKITGTGDFNSAIDAISDMQNGEFERIQTILGIKKQNLEDYANEKGLAKFTNKKGQITDKDALMTAFESYLGDKGITGMTEKFGKTMEGRISTLKGNFKKTLAEIAGIGEDGTVKEGSLFDNATKGLEKLITSVNNFAKSESFERIASGLGKVGNALVNGLDYLTQHPDTVSTLGKLGIGLSGLKVATSLISPLANVTKLIGGNGLTGAVSLLGSKLPLVSAGFLALGSIFNENGILNKGINNFVNNLNNNKDGEKKDYVGQFESGIGITGALVQKGFAKLTGNTEWDKSLDEEIKGYYAESNEKSRKLNSDYYKWYDGKNTVDKTEWTTVPDMFAKGEISNITNNTTTNTTGNNKTEVNVNIDSVRETADIDDIINQIATKINKINNTRNPALN